MTILAVDRKLRWIALVPKVVGVISWVSFLVWLALFSVRIDRPSAAAGDLRDARMRIVVLERENRMLREDLAASRARWTSAASRPDAGAP